MVVDPKVIYDPVFQMLLAKHLVAGRQLRDAVITMRSFYLTHHKRPLDETVPEKWRAALFGELAAQYLDDVRDAAADLLRYAYELAPYNNFTDHLKDVAGLRAAHYTRLTEDGWGEDFEPPRGIEHKVYVDAGPPVTIIFRPTAYEFVRKLRQQKPAILCQETDDSSQSNVQDSEP